MLNVKKLLTKILKSLNGTVTTVTATTGSTGNAQLSIPSSARNVAVEGMGGAYMGIPFKSGSTWYVKVVAWNNSSALAPVANTNVTMTIRYVCGGGIVSTVFSMLSAALERRWKHAECKETAEPYLSSAVQGTGSDRNCNAPEYQLRVCEPVVGICSDNCTFGRTEECVAGAHIDRRLGLSHPHGGYDATHSTFYGYGVCERKQDCYHPLALARIAGRGCAAC